MNASGKTALSFPQQEDVAAQLQPAGRTLNRFRLYTSTRNQALAETTLKTSIAPTKAASSAALTTAAQRLRYEAVLEAVGHMGNDVTIQERDGCATCSCHQVFAAIRPNPQKGITVGLAADAGTDARLHPSAGDWECSHITAQFDLDLHEPIRGWQLHLLRRAYQTAQVR